MFRRFGRKGAWFMGVIIMIYNLRVFFFYRFLRMDVFGEVTDCFREGVFGAFFIIR